MSSTQWNPETRQAVLVNMTYDALHPMTDKIALRFSDGEETYTQHFITASMYTFSSPLEVMEKELDPSDKLKLQFFEAVYVDEKTGLIPARLVLSTPQDKRYTFYDNGKKLVQKFGDDFELSTGGFILVAETQAKQKVEYKV